MAYVVPTTRADGYVVTASEWNKNTVDNPVALKALIDANTTSIAALSNDRSTVCGRLSLTSGTPVTTSDVTAATTVYYALYRGNQIALYTGSAWVVSAIAELSIAVPATTDTNYDVFVDYNDGTPQLAVTAWTNATTRATALTTQDGVYVKTGDTQQRYVGSFRTTGVSGQTEDSAAKRFVWNYYNRVERLMLVTDSTSTWTYTTATWRQANGATGNQLAMVVGVSEEAISAHVVATVRNSVNGTTTLVGIGLDSTSAPSALTLYSNTASGGSDDYAPAGATWVGFPGIGYHTLVWLEYSAAAGTTTWAGTNADFNRSGIRAVVKG